MDKSAKIYTKALEKFNNGEIEASLILCEKSISGSLKNSSALNLKGLLYYLKGDLDSAQALWKMNYDMNRDAVSKKYLSDSKEDKDKLLIYKSAINLVKELEIKDALVQLEKCSESDFNFINVNNYKSICFIKTGEYKKAEECIKNVLRYDNNNKMALENKKTMLKYGMMKDKQANKRVKSIAAVALILVISACILGFYYKNCLIRKNVKTAGGAANSKPVSSIQTKTGSQVSQNSQSGSNQSVQPSSVQGKGSTEQFPSADIKSCIDSSQFDKLYDYVMSWKDKNLDDENKTLIINGENLLNDKGTDYYYKEGSSLKGSQQYAKALEAFTKAYTCNEFGNKSYLAEHIIYMLGNCSECLGNSDNAISYYEQYLKQYPSGSYGETVLYGLSMLYKNKSMGTAKSYAQQLVSKYPESIYNNSNIHDILSK